MSWNISSREMKDLSIEIVPSQNKYPSPKTYRICKLTLCRGTGKTTTARKMGKVFYDMGFLATAELIEVSATDLIGFVRFSYSFIRIIYE